MNSNVCWVVVKFASSVISFDRTASSRTEFRSSCDSISSMRSHWLSSTVTTSLTVLGGVLVVLTPEQQVEAHSP